MSLSDEDGKVYISGKNIYISKAAKDAIIAIFISEERKKVIDDDADGWVQGLVYRSCWGVHKQFEFWVIYILPISYIS